MSFNSWVLTAALPIEIWRSSKYYYYHSTTINAAAADPGKHIFCCYKFVLVSTKLPSGINKNLFLWFHLLPLTWVIYILSIIQNHWWIIVDTRTSGHLACNNKANYVWANFTLWSFRMANYFLHFAHFVKVDLFIIWMWHMLPTNLGNYPFIISNFRIDRIF